jgi:hypothetical protein
MKFAEVIELEILISEKILNYQIFILHLIFVFILANDFKIRKRYIAR